MSSHPEQPQQPTIRHIPIYVEGRSEPLVNTVPETKPSTAHSMPEAPRMEMPTHSSGDFFAPGKMFNRVRDFPVRTFPNSSFFNRDPSPGRQVPTFNDSGSHAGAEQPAATNVPRGTSTTLPRKTPSPPTAQSHPQQQHHHQTHFRHQQQAPQHQPSPQPQPQQHQQAPSQQHSQPSQPQPMEPPGPGQDQPDCRPKAATVKEDPITKIQRIQKDVLDIFDQVENFQGGPEGKKDKRYVYLDEMLTQNLLKLDSIDAEDQPQIKSARREAIKSINKCIAVLEAKAEAGGTNSAGNSGSSINSGGGGDPRANGMAEVDMHSNASLTHSSSNSSQQQQQQSKASAQQ